MRATLALGLCVEAQSPAICSVLVGGMSSTVRSPRSAKRKPVDAPEDGAPLSPRRTRSAAAQEKVEVTVTAAAKPADPTHSSKLHTLIVRTITGLVMMFGFILIMFSDHAIISAFVVLLQIMVYREMTLLRYREAKEKDIPFFRSLAWYVLFASLRSSKGGIRSARPPGVFEEKKSQEKKSFSGDLHETRRLLSGPLQGTDLARLPFGAPLPSIDLSCPSSSSPPLVLTLPLVLLSCGCLLVA